MAVENPVLYNDFWTYLRDTMGSTHLNPSDKQIHNAYKMRTALQAQGYCEKALCGVIGCAQQESSLTTGAIEKWSILPNYGETLAEVTNAYMIQYYTPPDAQTRGYALGLLQWDGLSATYQTHKLVGWCNANGYNWYDGVGQMARLDFEFTHDSIYNFWRNNYGPDLTWAVYKDIENSQFSNYDAGECAAVWDACWERSTGEGREIKRQNAIFWYNYFNEHPTPPGEMGIATLFTTLFKKRRVINNVKRFSTN